MLNALELDDVVLHYRDEGPREGPAVVFANSLGTDMRLWDPVVPYLPEGLRVICYDMRGHGLSGCPQAPYTMGALVRDAERLLDALDLRDTLVVGLSIGGMVAQGLAAKRLDLVRAVVLSNTATKIGTRALWQERIAQVEAGGLGAMSDAIMARWFSRSFRDSAAARPWRRMVETTPAQGYAGCSAAIAGTDFMASTAALRLPALVIAGSEDGSTPPDLVRELADLIPGARYELIRGAGHLPCVEAPEAYAALLCRFIAETGHGARAG